MALPPYHCTRVAFAICGVSVCFKGFRVQSLCTCPCPSLLPLPCPLLEPLQVLELSITTTWGDPHYVGLSGIEIFDGDGQLVHFPDPHKQISADPADVNVLPGHSNDPRTVDKAPIAFSHDAEP